jgi:hypothetical protein
MIVPGYPSGVWRAFLPASLTEATMWITLTNMQNKPITMNMDHVVHMEEFGDEPRPYTALGTAVAKSDEWLVFRVKESIDVIITLIRDQRLG